MDIDWYFIAIVVIGCLVIGFIGGLLVYDSVYINQRDTDGCWAQIQNGNQEREDWVCVNIYDMSYERALEVASHEIGHEIFAEECEKDEQLCFDLVEELNNA